MTRDLDGVIEPELEAQVVAVASERIKENPTRCPMRIMAETVLDMDPRKYRVRIDRHPCKHACPKAVYRRKS